METRTGYEIAVIGMAGVFPGAKNIDEFWNNLKNGAESIVFQTDEELKEKGIDPTNLPGNYVRCKGGFLEDKTLFDATFFGYLPNEAVIMEPQLRKLHEYAWEALENAGYNPDSYSGLVGCYVGGSDNFYWRSLSLVSGKMVELGEFVSRILMDHDYLATRLSYRLNLKGPSVSLGSACSTSLVAIHMACRALLSGECDMALAGGVALAPERNTGYYYSDGAVVSPDGHCRAFDEKARGTVGGEGCGIVLLKALEDAENHGDFIHAIVKSSIINNDGARKVGFTAPSIDGQVEVIRAAVRMAEVEPESITYVETHGTGTELGDPVEVEALKLAFNTDKKGYCAIGSVKTNVGHLNHAAGVAGFIKTVLALKHRLIPPSLYFETPNPKIDFIASPFYVNASASVWEPGTTPRRAGVSSFGLGGTNAHVILEEAPRPGHERQTIGNEECQLILLSAKTKTALDKITINLVEYFQNNLLNHDNQENPLNPGLILADAAYTLQVGRKAFQHRRMAVCATIHEAVACLSSPDSEAKAYYGSPAISGVYPEKRPVVFILPPIVVPIISAIMELYRTHLTFRHEMDRCFDILDTLVDYNIKEIFYSSQVPGAANISYKPSTSDINQTEITQLRIFIIEYALASLLIRWGIKPSALVGEGVGEYVAACLSGVFSLDHALRILVNGEKIDGLTLKNPGIPLIPGTTGTWIIREQGRNPRYEALPDKGQDNASIAERIKRLPKEPAPIFVAIGSVELETGPIYSLVEGSTPPHETISASRHLLNQVGRLWRLGVTIDWQEFQAGQKRYRLPLPTYPFEQQSYWIEGSPFELAEQKFTRSAGPWRKPDTADWFYIPSWKRSILLQPRTPTPPVKHCWLIFADGCGVADHLVERLTRDNQELIVVKPGTTFGKIRELVYTVNPAKNTDYDALFKEFHRLNKIPGRIVHLWGVTTPPPIGDHFNREAIDQVLDRLFYSMIYLAQSIGKKNLSNSFQIAVVTNHLFNITGEEEVFPEKALVIGPVRVIPLEYRNISCSCIDIADPGTEIGSPQREIVWDQLLTEFALGLPDPVISYRGGYRWEPTLEPHRLKAPSGPGQCSRLREGGVYLITGGIGGIGYVMAEALASGVHARLILIGRSPFPPRDQWQQWLDTHNEQDNLSQKIRKVQALERLGGQVLVCSADVADPEQMQKVKDAAWKRFGPINGVIHSAGLADGGMIPRRTRENTDTALAPKIQGTLVLADILRDVNLDFFISCSSLNSIVVPIGQVGYCSANAFQDAFAHRKSNASGKWKLTTAINWDVWREVGMGVEAARFFEKEKGIADAQDVLKDGIANPEGVAVFLSVLQHQFPQTVISTRDLFMRMKQFLVAINAKPEDITTVETFSGTAYPRPELSTEYEPPRTEFEKIFADILKKFFGYEKVGINDNFFEFGLTSLTIIRINGLLREAVNKTIPIVSMFENPTILSLGRYLEQEEKEETVTDEENEESLDLERSEELLYDSIELLRDDE